MPGAVFRQGETVELRTIEPEDADTLQEIINDPRVRTDLMAVDPVNGPAEREWIESLDESDSTNLLVCVDSEAVGSVTLKAPNGVWGTAEIGYMIAPDAWGNGYATDAVTEICGYAFEERRLHKVYATAYESNDASCRVLEKVGFTEEGVLREEGFVDGDHVDVCRYGLLASEWPASA